MRNGWSIAGESCILLTMYEEERLPMRRRKSRHLLQRVLHAIGYSLRAIGALFGADITQIVHAWRLFLGATLVVIGILSFASDRYCDGNTSTYAACTRPSTYYYYPWWGVGLVVLGTLLVTLWMLRRK